MALEKILWKIPAYKRRKVIEIVDTGQEQLEELPVYNLDDYWDTATHLLKRIEGTSFCSAETRNYRKTEEHNRWVESYLHQSKFSRIFNKYQIAEGFIKKHPEIDNPIIIALIGNLYSEYRAGCIWADGANPNPELAKKMLNGRINNWADLLSDVFPNIAQTFREVATQYITELR